MQLIDTISIKEGLAVSFLGNDVHFKCCVCVCTYVYIYSCLVDPSTLSNSIFSSPYVEGVDNIDKIRLPLAYKFVFEGGHEVELAEWMMETVNFILLVLVFVCVHVRSNPFPVMHEREQRQGSSSCAFNLDRVFRCPGIVEGTTNTIPTHMIENVVNYDLWRR